MKRGDLVIVSAPGDYGKPRPAVIIQSDWLKGNDSVLVCLLTSTLLDVPLFRLNVDPTKSNGLKLASQIMIDKILAFPRDKCGGVIGKLDQTQVIALNNMLSVVIGLAD